jgi:hypothetical protein
MSLIVPRRRLIVPAVAIGLAAPAIILAPKIVAALEAAGIANPTRLIDVNALPPKVEAAFRRALIMQAKVQQGRRISAPSGKVLTYLNRYIQTTNTTTYTFASCDLGVASADRRVIVGAHMYGSTSRNLSSATINGVTATEITTDSNNAGNCILIIANVTTDATGDIVLTWSGSCAGSAVSVWYATGLSSDTPVAAASNISISAPTSGSLSTVDGGFIVCASFSPIPPTFAAPSRSCSLGPLTTVTSRLASRSDTERHPAQSTLL